jgi:hypothetical protein
MYPTVPTIATVCVSGESSVGPLATSGTLTGPSGLGVASVGGGSDDPESGPGDCARAIPKSPTTTRPSLPRKTLSGLKSRCHDAARVRRLEAATGCLHDGYDFAPAARLRKPRLERLPFHVLHRDEDTVAERAHVVHAEDVRVSEARHRLRLAKQARVRLVVSCVGP